MQNLATSVYEYRSLGISHEVTSGKKGISADWFDVMFSLEGREEKDAAHLWEKTYFSPVLFHSS